MGSPQMTVEQAKSLAKAGYTVYNPQPAYAPGTIIGAGSYVVPPEQQKETLVPVQKESGNVYLVPGVAFPPEVKTETVSQISFNEPMAAQYPAGHRTEAERQAGIQASAYRIPYGAPSTQRESLAPPPIPRPLPQQESLFLSPYDKSRSIPESGKPMPEMVRVESPKIFEVPKGSLSKRYGEGWEGATGFLKENNTVTPIIFFERGGKLSEDYILTHELTHATDPFRYKNESMTYGFAETKNLKYFGEIKLVNATQRFTDMNVTQEYELVPTTGGALFAFKPTNKGIVAGKELLKDFERVKSSEAGQFVSKAARPAAESITLGAGLVALSAINPPAGFVVTAGLLGKAGKDIGASFAEKGVGATLKEQFATPEGLGTQAGFLFGAKAGADVVSAVRGNLFKVTTAEGVGLKEVGAVKDGQIKKSVAVKPFGEDTYYTPTPPKINLRVELVGKEKTLVAGKTAVVDMVADVKKSMPRQVIAEAPSGFGTPGTTKLFDLAKREQKITEYVKPIITELRAIPQEGIPPERRIGTVEPTQRLSPTSQKLLDTAEIASGTKTEIKSVGFVEQYGDKVKVSDVARTRPLKEVVSDPILGIGVGRTLRKGTEVKGIRTYGGAVGGRLVEAKGSLTKQRGGVNVFDVSAKVEGKLPDVVYVKEGKYGFVGKAKEAALDTPQEVKIYPAAQFKTKFGSLFGLAKRKIRDFAGGTKEKIGVVKASLSNALTIVKTGGEDSTVSYLKSVYKQTPKENKIKFELKKEVESESSPFKEVKTKSGVSVAVESPEVRMRYDKPVSVAVPINVKQVFPELTTALRGVPTARPQNDGVVGGSSVKERVSPAFKPEERVGIGFKTTHVPSPFERQRDRIKPVQAPLNIVRQTQQPVTIPGFVPAQGTILGEKVNQVFEPVDIVVPRQVPRQGSRLEQIPKQAQPPKEIQRLRPMLPLSFKQQVSPKRSVGPKPMFRKPVKRPLSPKFDIITGFFEQQKTLFRPTRLAAPRGKRVSKAYGRAVMGYTPRFSFPTAGQLKTGFKRRLK